MSDLSIKYKNNEIATLSSSGTKTIKTKGKYCEDDITIVYDKPEQKVFTTEEKTVTPTESAQEITPTSADGLSKVTVEAISSSYVGSAIPKNPTPTVNGATVSVPNGYYEEDTSKNVASGSLGTVTATKGTVSNNSISITPSINGGTVGYISETSKTGDSVTVSASELVRGNMALFPSENFQSFDVTNIATATVASISIETKEAITPTKSSQTINATSGKYMKSITVNAIPDEYIDTSDANVVSNDIISGKTAYANGEKVVGNMDLLNLSEVGTGMYTYNVDATNVNMISVRNGIGVSFKYNGDINKYVKPNSIHSVVLEDSSTLGDADTSSVLSGKIFTSSFGLKQTGTLVVNKCYVVDSKPSSANVYSEGDLILVKG